MATIVDYGRFVEIQKRRARVAEDLARVHCTGVANDAPDRPTNGAGEGVRSELQSTVERKETR